jgi:hypothetical protein
MALCARTHLGNPPQQALRVVQPGIGVQQPLNPRGIGPQLRTHPRVHPDEQLLTIRRQRARLPDACPQCLQLLLLGPRTGPNDHDGRRWGDEPLLPNGPAQFQASHVTEVPVHHQQIHGRLTQPLLRLGPGVVAVQRCVATRGEERLY